MASQINLNAERKLLWGEKVSRAAATLPQSTHAPIFNVLVGRVLIHFIVGQVTTILGTVGNMKLIAEPTVGVATDLCAVVAAGTLAVGRMVSITGLPGDAMVAQVGAVPGLSKWGLIVDVGTIDLNLSASDTGAMRWDVLYTSLDDGAYMTAA